MLSADQLSEKLAKVPRANSHSKDIIIWGVGRE